jgi:NitT/TauT family transport system ATP-binding protein
MSSKAVAIDIQGVSVAYESSVVALDDFSLKILEGRTIGVVGPSGCGKSTLLSLLAGLQEPTRGSVEWHSSGSDSEGHDLTMMFQRDTLLPWLTVRQNVELYFSINKRRLRRSHSKAEITAQVDELLQLVGLQDFSKAYPYQLSGGMRRRVALLVSVAPHPKVLLLDEPFSALDEPTRVAVHQDVLRIIQQLRMTVVLVTHDLAEAASLCDEVVVLTNRPGRVFRRHVMPFGEERNVLELRQQPNFLSLYSTLWHDLSLQIAGSATQEPS